MRGKIEEDIKKILQDKDICFQTARHLQPAIRLVMAGSGNSYA